MLCGWYAYMAVLAVLATMSAGAGTALGRAAIAAALSCALLMAGNWWAIIPSMPADLGPYSDIDLARLAPHLLILGVAFAALLRAPRQDTRLIALLLAGAGILPMALFFCRVDGGLTCLP
jgi:hypothetical protein